jgi:N-acetylmuramic acid 6-phosphate etherase
MNGDDLSLTEEINPSTEDLDLLPTAELLHRINDEDRRAAWAVERELAVIAAAVDAIVERLRGGGKLHYFGAGTSGRIAAMDAAEMRPTFGAGDIVRAHLAGGEAALAAPVEGAEDDGAAGRALVREERLGSGDAVVGISAGGTAGFVIGACDAAREAGALTVCITNNPDGPLAHAVQIPIVLRTGAEVIAGSTRMKAGAAQKMALTALSTAVMVKLGKVYGNLMVELEASNAKLRERARRLVVRLSGTSAQAAARALEAAGYRAKTAVVMVRRQCSAEEADLLLAQAGGSLRSVLDATPAGERSGRSQR